jgi:hypothetical protein
VEPRLYDHIHMIFQRADLDIIIGIEDVVKLKSYSIYFKSELTHNGETWSTTITLTQRIDSRFLLPKESRCLI